jgi:hypothetical protein
MDEEMGTLLATKKMTCDYNSRSGRWHIYDKFSRVVAVGKADSYGEAREDIVKILRCIEAANKEKRE